MDLSLTWRGDYVVRAATELGRRHGDDRWHKAEDLAKATGIPAGYIRQILRMLVQAGLAAAHAGTNGGYRLARDPREISILDIVETGDGPLGSTRCAMRGTGCSAAKPCSLHAVLSRAHQALRTELQNTTLSAVLSSMRPYSLVTRR